MKSLHFMVKILLVKKYKYIQVPSNRKREKNTGS